MFYRWSTDGEKSPAIDHAELRSRAGTQGHLTCKVILSIANLYCIGLWTSKDTGRNWEKARPIVSQKHWTRKTMPPFQGLLPLQLGGLHSNDGRGGELNGLERRPKWRRTGRSYFKRRTARISGRTLAKDTGWFPSSSCVPVKLAGSHAPVSQSWVISQRRELQSLSSWFLNFTVYPEHLGHLLKKPNLYQRQDPRICVYRLPRELSYRSSWETPVTIIRVLPLGSTHVYFCLGLRTGQLKRMLLPTYA